MKHFDQEDPELEKFAMFCHENSSDIKNAVYSNAMNYEEIEEVSPRKSYILAIRDIVQDFFVEGEEKFNLPTKEMEDWLYTFCS